jgi:RNA-binding protein NOB1
MGFILLTMDGMRLTRVKRFKLLCRACFRLNLDVERKFCEKCGAHTLNKVSCFINESGKVTFFDNPKRRINLRGTIYSIPKAKGGRNNKDLILREDEFMTGEKMMKLKHIEKEKRKEESAIKNTLEGNYWAGGQGYAAGVSSLLYENGAKGGTKGKNNNDFKIGYGKKNPNISRRKV